MADQNCSGPAEQDSISAAAAAAAVEDVSYAPVDNDLPSYESLTNQSNLVRPRTVHIDGVLVFPSEPPANALYQLSRDLIAGTRITIQRIDHEIYTTPNSVPKTRIKDRLLYTFAHAMFDDSSIEIIGKRKDCFVSALMTKTGSMKESTWTVRIPSQSEGASCSRFLECRSGRRWLSRNDKHIHEWRNFDGVLIAVEESPTQGSEWRTDCVLRIIEPLEQKQADLLVTAWCARIWNQNLKATGQIRTITKAKNAYFRG